MRFPRKRGSTSVMIRVFIPDNSVTTGAGLSTLTSGSTNLTIAYIRELDGSSTTYTGANIEAQTTVGTYQAPSTSSKIRFKPVDTTSFPGVYELQFHDSATAFGTGDTSQHIVINIYEATTTALHIGPNMVLIPLVPWDYQDGVRMGLTALPNAAAAATGGVPVIGTGSNNFKSDSSANVTFANTSIATVTTVTNQLTAAAIATGVWQDTTAGDFTVASSIGKSLYTTGNAPGAASGLALVGSNMGTVSSVSGSVNSVTTGVTVTTNNDKTGYSLSVAPPTAAQNATAVWQDTTAGDFTVASSIGKSLYTTGNAPGAASGLALVGSNMGSVSSVSGTVTVGTNNDKTGYSLTQTFPANFSALGISAAGKINEVVLTDTLTTYTGDTPQTGDAYARIGVAGVGLTNLGDTRIANLDAAVSTRTKPADTQAAVTTVTNLTNAPTNGDFTAVMKTSLNNAAPSLGATAPAGWINAAAVAASALNGKGDWASQTSVTNTPGLVWDVAIAGHLTAGTTGKTLSDAGASGDPWSVQLPGAYAAHSAGEIVAKLDITPPGLPVTAVPGPPADVALCRVYGYIETLNNKPAVNLELKFELIGLPARTDRLISGNTFYGKTDSLGRVSDGANAFIDLQRNDNITPAGTKYKFTCLELGIENTELTLTTNSFDLSTIVP